MSPSGKLVGYTVGNDVSSRDIEGENPLYLPQAKIYRGSCALGPLITLVDDMPDLADVNIRLEIVRGGAPAFEGSTSLSNLNPDARKPDRVAGARERVPARGVPVSPAPGSCRRTSSV